MFIYKTTNISNGRIYIGKMVRRQSTYLGSGKLLKLAIQKYGKENFVREILEECESKEQLNAREKFWIAHFKSQNVNLYNIAPGGEGGNTGVIWNKGKSGLQKHSEETKNRISQKNKGHLVSEANKKVLSLALRGKPKSVEQRRKMSLAKLGKSKSEAHRKAISLALRGRKRV